MMQSGNQRETRTNGSQEAGKNVGDLLFKYLFDFEHSNEKAFNLVCQSESTKHGVPKNGINDGALSYTECPKNLVGSSLPPKDSKPCAHKRNICNFGDLKGRTTEADILTKDLIDLRDSNQSGDFLFSDLVWSSYERGRWKHRNSEAWRNEETPHFIGIDPLNNMKQSSHQTDNTRHMNSKDPINEGDFHINDFIELRDNNDRADLLFQDSVLSNYGKDSFTRGDHKSGTNEGEHFYSRIEPVKDLMQSGEKRDCIKHETPNLERNEGDLLIKGLMQRRHERKSNWIDIPMARSIEGHPLSIFTEPAVSFQNCYNQVQEEKKLNYESMQKQDYNEFNTRVAWYNEEMDDLLSRISNNYVVDVNETGVESAILEECQITETFDLNSDSVEISSTFLSSKEDSAKRIWKEKKCDDKSFVNNKLMGSRNRSTTYISSSSTKDYHLESSSGEKEEEVSVVLKPIFLQATTLMEKEKNRDVEDDECVILNLNPFHPNNIDIHPMVSLSYNDPSGLQDDDVTIISERGQVACRDYPHSRHHCVTFPFDKTSHYTCCRQCYCFVCDQVAPCKYWNGNSGHCHASDRDPKWKGMRAFQRVLKKDI